MTSAQTFFTQPGPMTDAGALKSYLDNLPGSVAELCCVIQGLMIHIFWADQYGVALSDERRQEVQLRTSTARLKRLLELDTRPLTETRPPEKRVVGNCRDFSVLLTAVLRHHHIPARARCGFGRYFLPNHYEDHWVAEYWHAAEGRWVLVDAQLDELQCAKLAIPFDPLDVPRDQFIVGGRAWQLCRSGDADAEAFGIHDMHGLWFVRGNLVRDVAALNNMELLPWDAWGLIEGRDEDLSAGDYRLLDDVAALTCGDVPAWERVRALYESDGRLRVPPVINSYTAAGPVPVTLLDLEMKGYR
ncbi:MAG: transglutaminase domain-containing protein [Anaerolineaceae bacterium]|nr:transglutaminase domain-containing protein [Anaerolineaceae bacterium]